jgi:antitoxin HicB
MQMKNLKTKTTDEYLKEPYGRLLIQDEDGTYSAEIIEFTGCFSQGDTADEAMKNLDEAARNWIEETKKQGKPIPEPMANAEFSGKFALRLPRGLHRKASIMAAQEGVSLNTFFVDAIARRVGKQENFEGLLEQLESRLIRQTATNVFARVFPELTFSELRESVSNIKKASTTPSFSLIQKITFEEQ